MMILMVVLIAALVFVRAREKRKQQRLQLRGRVILRVGKLGDMAQAKAAPIDPANLRWPWDAEGRDVE